VSGAVLLGTATVVMWARAAWSLMAANSNQRVPFLGRPSRWSVRSSIFTAIALACMIFGGPVLRSHGGDWWAGALVVLSFLAFLLPIVAHNHRVARRRLRGDLLGAEDP
jgi:hypothetical protein